MKTIKILSSAFFLLIALKSYSETHVIQQSGTSFSPSTLNVTVGDIIRWEWSGGTHTTTSKVIPDGAAAWDSPLSATTISFEYAITVAGVYNYVCTPHESMGMIGSFTASIPNGVNQNKSLSEFSIYPNPANTFINITTGMDGVVLLSDILGKDLKNINLNELPSIAESRQLDLSNFKKGIYILSIISSEDKKSISHTFIKK